MGHYRWQILRRGCGSFTERIPGPHVGCWLNSQCGIKAAGRNSPSETCNSSWSFRNFSGKVSRALWFVENRMVEKSEEILYTSKTKHSWECPRLRGADLPVSYLPQLPLIFLKSVMCFMFCLFCFRFQPTGYAHCLTSRETENLELGSTEHEPMRKEIGISGPENLESRDLRNPLPHISKQYRKPF